jgi:predicted MPP superfamily phosphohydrolase
LVLAGVDDLSARRQFKMDGDPVARALENHPPGALVFLSHSPLEAEKAASLGAGLMLSGHTHDGQLWPFGLLVRVFYPFLRGRYAVGGMTLLVSRGSGTWGPPMRLFAPCEVWRITLRTAPAS